jgi:hypothetical protein
MAGRIIYLESDDEITSAATRIRGSEAPRLAVVLPYGSRVATSRINFRLLSRDALTHDKRLSIVSADPATRALAASAGLPVFASVSEYDASLAGLEEVSGASAEIPAAATEPEAGKAPARAAGTAPTDDPESDGTLGLVVPVAAAGAATRLGPPFDTVRTALPRVQSPAADRGPIVPVHAPGGPGPVAGSRASGSGRIRTPWAVGAAILGLAVLIAGVGVYLLLPSATIAVTPRTERIAPINLNITADPTATQPDATRLVVPAKQVSVPVSVSDTFDATGKRVQLANATGTVRFDNLDPTSSNRVASGSIVKTASGVRFRTAVETIVPRAQLLQVGAGNFILTAGKANVKVVAVDGGPSGNVDANTIVVVPNGENSLFLKVTNPDPTSGGTRQEFPRVVQGDIDDALAALNASLQESFAEKIADPAFASGGATVFPTTGQLGVTTPTIDPSTLLGQEVATFDLGLSATGTVVTADTAPIDTIAEQQLRATIQPDHQLVAGSLEIVVNDALITGQTVTFPVTAEAQQIAILDPAKLKAMVLGKSAAEAKSILAPFGQVDLTISPDWSGSVPTFESRVDLTITQAVQVATPSPSASGTP